MLPVFHTHHTPNIFTFTAAEEPKVVAFSNQDQIFELQDEKETKKEQEETFLAFARVFSGTLSKGKKLLVLGPKHEPQKALEGVSYLHSVN